MMFRLLQLLYIIMYGGDDLKRILNERELSSCMQIFNKGVRYVTPHYTNAELTL